MTAPELVARALERGDDARELADALAAEGLDPGDVRVGTKDAARLLKVTTRQVRRYAASGRIEGRAEESGRAYTVAELAAVAEGRAGHDRAGQNAGDAPAELLAELRELRAQVAAQTAEVHDLRAQVAQLHDLTVRALPPPRRSPLAWVLNLLPGRKSR